jgi:hypothetical protein
MRIHKRVGAVLVSALLISLAAGVSSASAGSSGSASPRIVSPRADQLVKRGHAKVVVKLPSGTSSFRAWLGNKGITGTFESHGSRQVADLSGSRLKRGVNSIYVKTKGAAGRGADSTSFIVARRDPHLLGLGLRVRGRAAPVVARATQTHGSELRATLNGSHVRDAFLQRRGETRVALFGAAEGVHFGKNRLVVKAVRRSGSYDVVKKRFRIPRDQPLASAGGDHRVAVGTSVELNAAATRLPPGGPPTGKPRYKWRIVKSAAAGDAGSATATGKRSGGPLQGTHTATPTFTPGDAGTYMIRVRVRARGAAHASRDTVFVSARPPDPPIGVRLETAGANGLITIDGKPVSGTGTDASKISYDLLDRTTRMAPLLCHSSVPFASAVPRTVAGIQTLEQLVHDCSDPRYMLILSSASGVGDDTALANELSKLLTTIGGSALGDEPTQAQFSVIGIPTAPEGSAFTSFGETPGTQQGKLSGYLQFEGAVNEYGFQFPDYPAFDTKPSNVADGEVGVRIGDQLITDPIPAGDAGCNPAPDRSTPCAGFQVVAIDRYDLHVRSHDAYEVNTGYDEADDQAEQSRMATAMSKFGANDLVFIQSYGKPRATTQAWDQVARQIQLLGGTRTVFDQLDGHGGYALVGSVCQPAGALGCNTGYGGSSAAVEMSSLPGGTGTLLGDVVSREPEAVRLDGLLSRNHDDQFDPAPTDPTTVSTNQLLPILYGPAQPFPQFSAGEQKANAWITKQLLGDEITPADLRQQYALHYDDPTTWTTRRADLNKYTYAQAAPTCGCSETEFNTVQAELYKEIGKVIYVENWVKQMQDVLDPTVKDYFELKSISDSVQAAVRPPDAKAGFDPGNIFEIMLEFGSIVLPEEGPILSLAYHSAVVFAGDDSGPDGAPLLDAIDERSSQVLSRIFVNYEYARGSLVDMGKIIVSDYGKLNAVAGKVNAGPWSFPSPDTPLRTAINKGFKTWMYSDLMPLVWAAYQVPGVHGGNARDLECTVFSGGMLTDNEPYLFTSDAAQYLEAVGMNKGQFPKPEIRNQTVALGRHGFPDDEYAKSPPTSLTDPLFAPANLDPGSPNLGLFPAAFYENDFQPDINQCGYR